MALLALALATVYRGAVDGDCPTAQIQCAYGTPNDGCPTCQHCYGGECRCNCNDPGNCPLPPCTAANATAAATARVAAAAGPGQPVWVGTQPDPTKPNAGLPVLGGTRKVTVYNITTHTGGNNSFGLYNHGPMVLFHNGSFLCAWYNAPLSESHQMRVVLASSTDAVTWTEPAVLFPAINAKGEENEPFATINGRLYAAASDVGWDNSHDTGELGALLMRRVLSATEFGPIFWLSTKAAVPASASTSYPLYSAMDALTHADAAQYLASLVNETVRLPPTAPAGVGDGATQSFNERSLYALPNSAGRSLVLLLRASHRSDRLWSSTCELGGGPAPGPPPGPPSTATYSCRSGTGGYMFEQPNRRRSLRGPSEQNDDPAARRRGPDRGGGGGGGGGPEQCGWTTPTQTNIPDAPSRTCAGRLPEGNGVGLLGNQGGPGGPNGSRDPLTFLVAQDGLHYDIHWVVESGSPKPKFPGLGHPQGFQYPSFMWCVACGVVKSTIVFSYSVSKENIQLTLGPLDSLYNRG